MVCTLMSAKKTPLEKLAKQFGIAFTNNFEKLSSVQTIHCSGNTLKAGPPTPLSTWTQRRQLEKRCPLVIENMLLLKIYIHLCILMITFLPSESCKTRLHCQETTAWVIAVGWFCWSARNKAFWACFYSRKNSGMLLCCVTAAQTKQSASYRATENEFHGITLRKYTCCLIFTPWAI